jgi:hypothetical protein
LVEGKCIALDRTTGERVEGLLHARLANTVSRVTQRREGVVVTFKRYLEPQTLSGPAASVVRLIADLSIANVRALLQATGQEFDLSMLRVLERERIIDLFLPEDIALSAFATEDGR